MYTTMQGFPTPEVDFSPPRISNVCTHVHVHIPVATVLKVLELLI